MFSVGIEQVERDPGRIRPGSHFLRTITVKNDLKGRRPLRWGIDRRYR